MKVLLVNSNRTFAMLGGHSPSVGLPLGLLYIAASLERHSIPVSLFDCLVSPQTRFIPGPETSFLGVDYDLVRAKLLAEQPDVVGISSQFTSEWENTREMVRLVSQTLPRCTIVLGGPHATVCGQEILNEHPEVGFIVAGEGELSFPRLIMAIASGERTAFEAIPGLLWREEDGQVRVNPMESIADLDTLPLPAYHLVDFDRLFQMQREGLFSRGNSADYAYLHSVSLITSRGCPYTCTFCSIHLSMGYKWRAHSVDYTLSHIRHLVEKFGVRHLHIEDDNFTFKRERANEICRRLIAEDIQITWDTPNGVRADTLNDELLDNMKKSGCTSLVIAAESGDQEVVDRLVKKKLDLKSIERAAALARKHDIPMGCFFVIGFPGETRRQIGNTLRYALKLYARYKCHPKVGVATPLPGTELARIVRDQGCLSREISPENLARGTAGTGSGAGMIKTSEFDPEYIRRCCARFHYRRKLIHAMYMLGHPGELRIVLKRRLFPRSSQVLLAGGEKE